jgi:hypothetical protein
MRNGGNRREEVMMTRLLVSAVALGAPDLGGYRTGAEPDDFILDVVTLGVINGAVGWVLL